MDMHQNARTTPHSRMLLVERLREGWTAKSVAAALGIDPRTVRKWRDRFAREGEAGMQIRHRALVSELGESLSEWQPPDRKNRRYSAAL